MHRASFLRLVRQTNGANEVGISDVTRISDFTLVADVKARVAAAQPAALP